ncbi:MAG: hypothetical protein PVJ55_02705, partial [Anaerolineae bacterium]
MRGAISGFPMRLNWRYDPLGRVAANGVKSGQRSRDASAGMAVNTPVPTEKLSLVRLPPMDQKGFSLDPFH